MDGKWIAITLRELLGGLLLPDKTRISCIGDFNGQGYSFTPSKEYTVYISKGSNRIYDDYGDEWSLRTLEDGRAFMGETLRVRFTLPKMFESKFMRFDKNKKGKTVRVDNGGFDWMGDIYDIDSIMWALECKKRKGKLNTNERNEEMTTKMNEMVKKINGEKEGVTLLQKVRSGNVIEVDLYTILNESKTFQSLKFGEDRLLRKIEWGDSSLILHTTEGRVEVEK